MQTTVADYRENRRFIDDIRTVIKLEWSAICNNSNDDDDNNNNNDNDNNNYDDDNIIIILNIFTG